MKAIILAAGEGTRLQPYTADQPKCMVELAGRALLTHQVQSLTAAEIYNITVVTGYRADRIECPSVEMRHNPDYAETNMVASLMCAADLLDGRDDILIAYGDIVYEPRIIEALCESDAPLSTTVDRSWRKLWQLRTENPLAEAETLKLGPHGEIVELGKKPNSYADIEGQYMGLIKVSARMAPRLIEAYRSLDPDTLYEGKAPARMYMTAFLQYLIDHGCPVRAVLVEGGWLEVDTAGDLERYNRLYRQRGLERYCRLIASRMCEALR